MKVYFVRHGQATHNILGQVNDNPAADVRLTDIGRQQAEAVATQLAGAGLELIVISRLPRTRQTAEIINRHHGAPIVIDPRIDDRRTGFDGGSWQDYLDAMAADFRNTRVGDGETWLEEKARLLDFLADLPRRPEKTVAVVGHMEPLQIIHAHLSGFGDEEAWDLRFDNCVVLEHELKL